jgi:hypothetical protein
MTQARRGRGRPPGASRLNDDDAKIMNDMAGIIARRPMKPTTAMRQLGIDHYATTKRLQRKWRSHGPVLIRAIEDGARRQREQLQAVATTAYRTLYDFANSPEIAAAAKALNQFATHPMWQDLRRQIEAASKSPMMQQIKAFANSPEMKRMNELMNSQETRRLRDSMAIPNTPEFKRMKEWMNSDEVRRLRDLDQNVRAVYPSLFFIPPTR